jgi:hypothetical protein
MAAFDQKKETRKIIGVLAAGIVLAVLAVVLFPRGSGKMTAQDQRHSAYYSAVDFIKGKYPAVKNCGDLERAAISDLGNNVWTVGVLANGVNTYNAPVQKFVTVKMQWEGGNTWLLKDIAQWE